MKNKQLQEQIDTIDPPSTTISPEQQKINLINANTVYFKQLLYLSIKIGCSRIFAFFIIILFDDFFIVTQGPNNFTQSWNIMFYVLASMLDFLGVLNDVQMIKHLLKDQHTLMNIKNDLLFNNPVVTETQIGSYTYYLSIYDIIKKYKYRSQSSISISETIRFLHVIITIYIFGNLAINGQNKIEGQYFKVIFLWLFILSIYLSVFELDFFVMEGSDGYFIEKKPVSLQINEEQLNHESLQQKQIKNQYFKRCRRPFQICYILNILLMLTTIILFFKYSLLNLMLILCICAHMIELVNEKYIQNNLIDLNLKKLPYDFLSGYKIIWYLTQHKKKFYLFSIILTRISIVLTVFAYFREQNTPAYETLILMVVNYLLFYGQYLKLNRLDSAKLYVLTPSKLIKGEGLQCAICLVQLQQKQNLLQLPCFSEHIYHYSCIKNWLSSRKQCPLCRYKLQKYQLS